jgi:hypothetical protein
MTPLMTYYAHIGNSFTYYKDLWVTNSILPQSYIFYNLYNTRQLVRKDMDMDVNEHRLHNFTLRPKLE